MLKGWPRKVTCAAIQPYFRCKSDLEVEDGCLLRGHRVVIPSLLRERLMYELHKGHFGIVKTKSSARSRMWWPYIDKDIEQCIGNCSTCTALRPAPPSAAPAPWPRPPGPWWRIHIDYMTIGQRVYLIVVDAFSKWLECFHMSSGTSTQALISKLKYLFSRFGLVKVICSDNDAKIKTVEFRKFCDVNGIEHVTSPIYHPASNGQAENSVRTCKKMLKCILSKPSRCVDEDLLGYLFQYRNTVHCATGLTPAKLMYGRDLRCRLDLVVPAKNTDNTRNNVSTSITSCSRKFNVGDLVLLRWYVSRKPIWTKGVIHKKIGQRLYSVFAQQYNEYVNRHIDQLIRFTGTKQVDCCVGVGARSPPPPPPPVAACAHPPPPTSPPPAPLPNVVTHTGDVTSNIVTIDEPNDEPFVDALGGEEGRDSVGIEDERPAISSIVQGSEPVDQSVPTASNDPSHTLAHRYNLRPRKDINYKK